VILRSGSERITSIVILKGGGGKVRKGQRKERGIGKEEPLRFLNKTPKTSDDECLGEKTETSVVRREGGKASDKGRRPLEGGGEGGTPFYIFSNTT